MKEALDEILEENKIIYDLPNRPIYIWLILIALFTFLWQVKIPSGFFFMTFSFPILAGLGVAWKLKKIVNLNWTYVALFIGLGSVLGIAALSFRLVPGVTMYGWDSLVSVLIIGVVSLILYFQYADYLIHKHSPISDYVVISHGPLFSSWLVQGLGYLFILSGITILIIDPLGTLFAFCLGGVFSLSRCGIILDKNNNSFKEYKSYLFIKTGKWRSFKEYPDAAILNLRYSQNANYGYFHSTSVKQETQKELVILTSNHRKRVLIKTFNSKEDAEDYSNELCNRLNLKLTAFSPEISAQTAARRRK